MILRSGTELINPFSLLERVGIREGQRVADLGCGALGHFVFPAARLVGGAGVVYAVDVQRPALEHIERTAKTRQLFNVYPVWSDIEVLRATRIDPATLDVALLVNNSSLLRSSPETVREMARLTRPGGRVVVVEWKPSRTPVGPPMEHRLEPSAAKDLMVSPLLKHYDDFEAGPYHYGMIYVRTNERVG